MIRCWCGREIDPTDNFAEFWCREECWDDEDAYFAQLVASGAVKVLELGYDTPS